MFVPPTRYRSWDHADIAQDPTVQKATGKTEPVDVMGALREMKNNS